MGRLLEVLKELKQKERSLMAFNLQNPYQINAARNISEENQTPLIIQFSERYLRFLAKTYGIPYLLEKYRGNYTYFHLDHCDDLAFIKQCIDWGFDSVMYDGSAQNISENIKKTKIVKEYAIRTGCLVEGELGKVAGVEDGFGTEGSSYAQLGDIDLYINSTKIDLMALGIGNAHGFYQDLNGLDMSILKNANDKFGSQFFVLHGGTGLPDEIINEAISCGVVKVNLSSQIKKRTIEILNEYLDTHKAYDEISFHKALEDKLGELFNFYMNKYTKI
jgi:ketose-bisphosphate aldolase